MPDHRLGMPGGGATIPVVEANFAAEVQHPRFQHRRRIEFEAHRVQLVFGRSQIGTESAQVFDSARLSDEQARTIKMNAITEWAALPATEMFLRDNRSDPTAHHPADSSASARKP